MTNKIQFWKIFWGSDQQKFIMTCYGENAVISFKFERI